MNMLSNMLANQQVGSSWLPPKPVSVLSAAGTNYVETLRVQLHANCRIRRIYFSDRLYTEEELPAEFKLFLPVQASAS
jgi:hypothetical protein